MDPTKKAPHPTPPGALSRGPGVLTRKPMKQTCLSSGSQLGQPEGFLQGSTRSVPPGPQPAPCSCAPSAASEPTASSSPGPGSPAPPRLQSPDSPPRTHDLGTAMWPRCRAERDWGAVRTRPPCSQACGDGQPGRGGSASRNTPATWSCFSKRGHESARSEEAEVQGETTRPAARRPAV